MSRQWGNRKLFPWPPGRVAMGHTGRCAPQPDDRVIRHQGRWPRQPARRALKKARKVGRCVCGGPPTRLEMIFR